MAQFTYQPFTMDIDSNPPAPLQSNLLDPLTVLMSELYLADKPAALKIKQKVSYLRVVTCNSLLIPVQVYFGPEDSSDSNKNHTRTTNFRITKTKISNRARRVMRSGTTDIYFDDPRDIHQESSSAHSPERQSSPLSANSLISSSVVDQPRNSHGVRVLRPRLYVEESFAQFLLADFRKADSENRSDSMPIGLNDPVEMIHSSCVATFERCKIRDKCESDEGF